MSEQETGPWPTGLSLARDCENWDVRPDLRPGDEEKNENADLVFCARFTLYRTGQQVPVARLRRIGWLDQKGRVYLKMPPSATFDGGSLTPLLIDARD